MNGTKYFHILNHLFGIQKEIDELLKDSYTNERVFLCKLQKKVVLLEKFAIKNWLEYRKDEESRE